MAENLFSKHRPSSFEEIFGHDKVKKEFIQRAKDNNWPQAIMITGKTGTGKNCLEKITSRYMLCTDMKDGKPCGKCEACQTVLNELISQYYFMFNASNLGIDEMRSIEELVTKKSLSTIQKKVIVIDELQEMVSQSRSLKAILKILERPAKNVQFILLAMDESRIPSALKNRCIHYRLKDLTFEEISTCLYTICKKENITIDNEDKANTLITIAQNSDGSMRTAISYLERCIYSDLWNPKTVLDELGILSDQTLISIVNKLLTGDVSIFENDITKEVLEKIRWLLNVLYKQVNGVKINSYMKSCVSSVKQVPNETIQMTIDKFNKLTYMPYLTQELIDFTVIDILNANKTSSTNSQPRVRERKKCGENS